MFCGNERGEEEDIGYFCFAGFSFSDILQEEDLMMQFTIMMMIMLIMLMILVVLTAYSSHADCNIPLQAAIVALPGVLSRYSTSARLYIYLIYSFDWSFLSTLFTYKWINLFIPLAALPGVLSWCSTSENEMPPNFLMVFYSSISNLILVKKKGQGFDG